MITLDRIGSPEWQQLFLFTCKLNVELHSKAQKNEPLDATVSAAVLVQQALTLEHWHQVWLPKLDLKDHLKLYFVRYHEAVCLNLLELLLAKKEHLEELDALTVDFIDYMIRKVVRYKEFENELEFQMAMSALCLLRLVSDHIDALALAHVSRLLNKHQLLLLLVDVLCDAPWLKKTEQGYELFEQSQWKRIQKNDVLRIGTLEGQVWFALYTMLLDQRVQEVFHFSKQRQKQILRIKPILTQSVLNQIPPLEHLLRHLEHLTMMDFPDTVFHSGIEELAELRLELDKVPITRHVEAWFNEKSILEQQNFAQSISEALDFEKVDALLGDPRCAQCGQPAEHRCSQCRLEWYCSRGCQVLAWKSGHKKICQELLH